MDGDWTNTHKSPSPKTASLHSSMDIRFPMTGEGLFSLMWVIFWSAEWILAYQVWNYGEQSATIVVCTQGEGGRIMFWGMLSSYRLGPSVTVEGDLNWHGCLSNHCWSSAPLNVDRLRYGWWYRKFNSSVCHSAAIFGNSSQNLTKSSSYFHCLQIPQILIQLSTFGMNIHGLTCLTIESTTTHLSPNVRVTAVFIVQTTYRCFKNNWQNLLLTNNHEKGNNE